jgi:hypothetical protein
MKKVGEEAAYFLSCQKNWPLLTRPKEPFVCSGCGKQTKMVVSFSNIVVCAKRTDLGELELSIFESSASHGPFQVPTTKLSMFATLVHRLGKEGNRPEPQRGRPSNILLSLSLKV